MVGTHMCAPKPPRAKPAHLLHNFENERSLGRGHLECSRSHRRFLELRSKRACRHVVASVGFVSAVDRFGGLAVEALAMNLGWRARIMLDDGLERTISAVRASKAVQA